ncbi:DUF1598 domain-containing protein [Roseiconus nitratireducens]|uniref:DUF1598 domain-containing protein n=1 Tax=Roseiconus nitratireducens TaxID=2605748 RepID=A0A5M6D7Y5_9BACT|nr:DUF1598 domain-containing protein [Roseiconus nitratireducens]KAA5543637.1 DUF1598 domain-containing protein [Roseiconus nitratireducens]
MSRLRSLRPIPAVGCLFAVMLTWGSLTVPGNVLRAEPPATQKSDNRSSTPIAQAAAAGEFALAKSLPGADQEALAGLAVRQSMLGETAAAIATLRQIDSPSWRREVIDRTRQAARGQWGGDDGQGLAVEAPIGKQADLAGGSSFADFSSLMNLIETTVAPDTWEALGGNSTMAPYPQGVFVDLEGTVTSVQSASDGGETLAKLAHDLTTDTDGGATDWREPSDMRCVSLRRLRDEIAARRITGLPLGDDLTNLAGLSEVQYLVFDDQDVVLAGPVGGIVNDRGWLTDRSSGRTTLRVDFLARCLAAAQAQAAFGCTIDPTPDGMRSAAEVAAQIRAGTIPIGAAAERLKSALGGQRIEVFGAAGDTPVALLMVEADRLMKQLALGQRPMPDGVGNYLQMVDALIDQGPPDGLLLRLWFKAEPQALRADAKRKVFELSGRGVSLSGENQLALRDGSRGAVTVDPRSQRFVEEFNQHWNAIRDDYPVFAALESLYRLAAVAQTIQQHGHPDSHGRLAAALAIEDDSMDYSLVAPKQVDSIATMHTVRQGKQRHHILLASGGVAVDVARMVSKQVEVYPTLSAQQGLASRAPRAVNRWWWDARSAP